MRFRKPWLRVKAVNFDFSAKSSRTDYNESNKSTPKFLAHTVSEKLLVELGVPKIELLHFSAFFAPLRSLPSPPAPPEPCVMSNCQLLIITSRISQTRSPWLI